MLLSSPVQGRKVTFVLSKPAFYNVEDAPSAVPTRKGDRNWTPAADKHPRPKTPAVPSVLKIPGGAISSRAQTPMHLGAVSQPPPGRPGTGRLPGSAKESDNYGEYSMTAVEVLPGSSGHGIGPRESAARRPQTPGALHTYAGASDASTAEGGEEETAALRFVRQAEAALRNATHREGMEQQQRSSYPGQAGMDVPGGGTSSTISKGKDAHGDSRTAGRKGGEAGSGGREGDGGGGLGAAWRPKGSSAASTQRPLSARDRAKGACLPLPPACISPCIPSRCLKPVHVLVDLCLRLEARLWARPCLTSNALRHVQPISPALPALPSPYTPLCCAMRHACMLRY